MNTSPTPETKTTPAGREGEPWLPILFVFGSAVVCFFLYRLGLPGQFIFDDYPNLKLLGNFGGVDDLFSLRQYLDASFAGPTGRPVSMLSFLIDAKDWPAPPGPFKVHNILIHLFTGVVLFWTLRLGLEQARVAETKRATVWIAAIAAALWMLHPFHVSTVLYIVQRMAQLSAFFSLVGLCGYLYGRRLLPLAPAKAYWIMSLSIGIGGSLAVLSKENGTLLPLLILVVEWVLLSRDQTRRPDWRWQTIFLFLPSLFVVGYLVRAGIMGGESMAIRRGFDVSERLLTEARVVLEYLWNLLIPRPHTQGMFRDGLEVSTSLLQPASTLAAVLVLSALLVSAIVFRKRAPLYAAAILFFLAGHLLESTTISLELVFEHRNYLPAALLFLPLAQLLVWAFSKTKPLALAATIALFVVYAGALAARADHWSNRTQLYMLWGMVNPDSARAQVSVANELANMGRPEAAIDYLEQAIDRLPESLLLRLHLARLELGHRDRVSLQNLSAIRHLQVRPGSAEEPLLALKFLTKQVAGAQGKGITPSYVEELWEQFARSRAFRENVGFEVQYHHHLGYLALQDGDNEKALAHFEKALNTSGALETGLLQSAMMAGEGLSCEALAHLAEAERLDAGEYPTWKHDYLVSEVARLKGLYQEDISVAGVECADTASAAQVGGEDSADSTSQ